MRRFFLTIVLLYSSWILQAIDPYSEEKDQGDLSLVNQTPFSPIQSARHLVRRNWDDVDPTDKQVSHRLTRTSKMSSCSVSRSALAEIKKYINSIPSAGVKHSCELNENNGGKGCNEFLLFVTCGIVTSNKLVDHALKSKLPAKYFWTLKKAVDKLNKDWEDNINYLRQELGTTINKLQDSLKRIQLRAATALKESRIASTLVVVSKIGVGQIDNAIKDYKSIQVDDVLSDILRQTLRNYGGPNSIGKIISFIKKLPTCKEVEESFLALFKIMQEAMYADSPKFVLLTNAVTTNSCPMKKLQQDYDKATQNALRLYVTNRAKAIRTGDDMAIINSAQNDWNEFRSSETTIIKEAYAGNHNNAERVLLFIANMPKKEDQAYAYPELFEEMTRVNSFNGHEILTLAYRANVLANGVLNVPVAVKDKLKRIRTALPSPIHALLFSSHITMVPNTNTNHRLGMVSGYGNARLGLEEPDIIACPSSTSNLYSQWKVEKLQNGRYFRFVNTQFSRSFGSVSAKCITVTKGSLSQHEWDVIPTRDGTLFWIKNRANGRLLEAGPNPYYQVPSSLKMLTCEFPWGRSQYGWIRTSDDSNKQLWKIS